MDSLDLLLFFLLLVVILFISGLTGRLFLRFLFLIMAAYILPGATLFEKLNALSLVDETKLFLVVSLVLLTSPMFVAAYLTAACKTADRKADETLVSLLQAFAYSCYKILFIGIGFFIAIDIIYVLIANSGKIQEISLKVYELDVPAVHRFPLSIPAEGNTYAGIYSTLLEKVKDVTNKSNIQIIWKDEEGDVIVISSDEVVNEALRHRNGDMFRIFVRSAGLGSRSESVAIEQTMTTPAAPMEDHSSSATEPKEKEESDNAQYKSLAAFTDSSSYIVEEPRQVTSSLPRPTIADEGCALRATPVDPLDARGYRFGAETHSRLEFDKMPGPIDKKANFSFQFRASSTNGLMFYVTNAEKTDYVALYMKMGRLVFSYNSGSGPALLESNRTFLDYKWHSVLAAKDGRAGKLYVNGHLEGRGTSKGGTDVINVDAPFFVGGLPPEWLPTATNRHVSGMVNSFGGCLRDFQLDGIPFGHPTMQHKVTQCSEITENGLYFGAKGGYAIVKQDLAAGSSFSFELELKTRVPNAVLLSISSSQTHSDFLTLQMINGVLKYSINAGAAPQHFTNTLDSHKLDLCDGRWHIIKIVKAKNVMSLSIDGLTRTRTSKIIRSLKIDTGDPLYLGGVPADHNGKGLDTKNSFVGCVRVIKIDSTGKGKATSRRRKQQQIQVNFDELTLIGDVNKRSS